MARVSGNSGRLSVAGMACLKAGQPARFFYRVHVHRRRKGSRPSLGEADYAALTARLFGVCYSLKGVSLLLHRLGFSPQVPAHRAAERNEAAIAAWRAVTWAKVRG